MDPRQVTYSFLAKLRQGEAVERDLDEYFADRYAICKASMAEQRAGIDRVFTDIESGETHRI